MSFQAMAWAINQNAGSPINKLVLLSIANYADENGYCYPSKERLAVDCECSKRTIDTAIESLIQLGILIKKNRFDGGKQTSNIYRINTKKEAIKVINRGAETTPLNDEEGCKICTGGVQNLHGGGAESAHKPINEPINEPINNIVVDFKKPETGEIAGELRKRLVTVTSDHPTLIKILNDGFTKSQILESLAIARMQKPEPERIHINYLDKILRSDQKQAKPKEPAWWATDNGILKKATELGLKPRAGESWQELRGRINQQLDQPTGGTACA